MALTGELTRTVVFRRGIAGSIDFSSTLDKRFLKAVAGIASFAGVLTRKVTFYRSTSGTVDFSGVGSAGMQVFYRAVGGVLSLVGAGSRTQAMLHKTASGVITFSGVAVRFRQGMYGELTRMVIFRRAISGAITPTGAAVTQLEKFAKAVAGVVSFAGAIGWRRKYFKNVEGQLGAFSLEDGGLFLLEDGEALLLESDLSGTLDWRLRFRRLVAGEISPEATLTRKKRIYRVVTGALTLAGAITWPALVKGVLASISFSGVLTRKVFFRRVVSGSLTTTGIGSRTHAVFFRGVSGVLTFIGKAHTLATLYTKKGLGKFGFWTKEE